MVFEVIIQYILCKTDNLILKLNLEVLPYIQFDRIEMCNSSSYVSMWSLKKIFRILGLFQPQSDPRVLSPFRTPSYYLRGFTPKCVLGSASPLNSTPTRLVLRSPAAPSVFSGNQTPGRGPGSQPGANWQDSLATGAWSRRGQAWALGRHTPLA